MLKRTGIAALAALAFLAPGFAAADAAQFPTSPFASSQSPVLPAVTIPSPMPAVPQVTLPQAVAPLAPLPTRHAETPTAHHGAQSATPVAPGQALADYNAWLARSPANREAVRSFRSYLAAQGLDEIVPVWQLIRTSSSWRECGADRFEVAPRDKWDNIVTTLRFVRDEVTPAVGEVEALSVYRNEGLNRCSHGAPASAHRLFFALDLTPVSHEVSRAGMISRVCAAHRRSGSAYQAGLGFYSGMRFHVDSHGYRKWGADGRGATSPCATGNYA